VFAQTLVTPDGCDSVIITLSVCCQATRLPYNRAPATLGGGVFTYNLFNQYGCDSTVTETVTLLPSDTTYLAFSTCDQSQAGTTLTVLPTNGLRQHGGAVTSLLPPSSCGVTASLSGSIFLRFHTGSLTLTATLGEAPFDYTVLLGGTSVSTGVINAVGVPQTISGLAQQLHREHQLRQRFQRDGTGKHRATCTTGTNCQRGLGLQRIRHQLHRRNGRQRKARRAVAPHPIVFVWSNGGNTQQINNIGTGNYSVTVTDANNCTNTASVTLNEPIPLSFHLQSTTSIVSGKMTGRLFVEPTGGVHPTGIHWTTSHSRIQCFFITWNQVLYGDDTGCQ